ncbi:MAG: branched-chain amino acid ABC transporter permease [Thermodesulfobacteriota bacterium]
MGRSNFVTLLIFAAIIVVFPLALKNPYYLRVATFAGINSLVCIGLSLLLGYAGQISIGQAGFFAIGAYSSAILTVQFGCNPWAGVAAGICLNALVAFLVGIPTLKLRGHYLAMATLGIGEIIHVVLKADTEDITRFIAWFGAKLGWNPAHLTEWLQPYRALTGGPSGLVDIPAVGALKWGSVELAEQYVRFYLVWGVVCLAMLLSLNLIHSRIGRALRAIHGNEEAARAMGVNTTPLKLGIFVISAGLASIAGSLYAHCVGFISPVTFSINESILFLVMVAVGGMMNVWGALVGTIIMTALPESLRFFHDFDILVYGLILLLIMMFMPHGIVGLIQKLFTFEKKAKTGDT